MFYIIFFCIIIIIIAIIIIYLQKKNRKQLKKCDLKDFWCHLKKVSSKKVSNKEKIIDYDKLYHKILLKAWYSGSFWDILKKTPREIQNINKIWELHKVRNLLVHEIWYPKWVDLESTASDYKKEVSKLLKSF